MTHVVEGLVVRICIGLPGACSSLDDDAAIVMDQHLMQTHSAIKLLQNDEYRQDWRSVLAQLADQRQLHGLLAGRSCRLLLDEGQIDPLEAAQRLNLALSTANEPMQAANWIEGFLKGSGLLLLHDDAIWQVLDRWVMALTPDHYTALLPLLRRTFSTFPAAERRQMGDRVKQEVASGSAIDRGSGSLDRDRADQSLLLIAQLLGLTP